MITFYTVVCLICFLMFVFVFFLSTHLCYILCFIFSFVLFSFHIFRCVLLHALLLLVLPASRDAFYLSNKFLTYNVCFFGCEVITRCAWGGRCVCLVFCFSLHFALLAVKSVWRVLLICLHIFALMLPPVR